MKFRVTTNAVGRFFSVLPKSISAQAGRMLLQWGVCLLLPCIAVADTVAETTDGPFLFSYFMGNGESGLHLAYSRDGRLWEALNDGKPLLQPEVGSKLMRDPSISRGPDGRFHMVWTTGWWDQGIGLAHSTDLVEWSEQVWLEVMRHEPEAQNCWAPEIYYDKRSGEFLVFWSTTIPGRFSDTDETYRGRILNHRMYFITTRDFVNYTAPRLFYDDGFNVIDGFILKSDDKYVLLLKDETFEPAAKNIRVATAEQASGPYGPASAPFSPDWVEGPTAIRFGPYWYVYYDAYTRGRMEGARTRDFQTWEDITETLTFPKGVRHGTAFTVSESELERLLALDAEAEE